MNWNDLAREVHQTAVENGLWDKPVTFDDIVCECLVHLGRAYEEHRSGRPNYYRQPHGAAAELGECVLRLLDYLVAIDVNVYLDFGFAPSPETMPGLVCCCTRFLAKAHIKTTAMDASKGSHVDNVIMCIEVICDWATQNNIDLESILRELHKCNKARAARRERETP